MKTGPVASASPSGPRSAQGGHCGPVVVPLPRTTRFLFHKDYL